MLKNYFIVAIASLAVILQSCDGFKKTETGLQYKILADSTTGKNAEMGDAVVLHIKYENAKDTLNTFKRGTPLTVLVQKTFQGGLEEGLTMLSKGDSAIFRISSDSLYTKMFHDSLPKQIKPGSFTDFTVKVVKIYTKEEVKKEQQAMEQRKKDMKKMQMDYVAQAVKGMLDTSKAQLKKDDAIIKDYIKKNNLTAQRTENGVYYVITKQGDGPAVSPGDTVAVSYTGKLLDGKEFDSSKGRPPFNVIVGVGQVIPGWDEALTKLNKGTVATIIIPSPLAYGKEGAKDRNSSDPNAYRIPPNAPLVFDIELVDVKK
jgi:FKBP-type peptidyl-prolyl cis-trans isomerase FkpA